MSAPAAAAPPDVFRGRAILILVLIGVAALAGFAVLAAYAPDLRSRADRGAHALSSSAVGFRGAQILLREAGVPVTVSRAPPSPRLMGAAGLVLTPPPGSSVELKPFGAPLRTLVVLPKWTTAPDPRRRGFVTKTGLLPPPAITRLLGGDATVRTAPGAAPHVLHGVGGPFAGGGKLPVGRIDRLQTLSGADWRPVLADADGRAVLAVSSRDRNLFVLADPDLLNNHGLADLDRARASVAILGMLSGEEGVVFDVTLNGLAGGRSLGRLMLEPPLLAATLCVVAAGLLMGWRALARFGAPAAADQPIAPGAAALVDNAAGLIRAAGKEAALAPEYAAATRRLVAEQAGATAFGRAAEGDASWLAAAAARRGLADPNSLDAAAAAVRKPAELIGVARRLYEWRLEMTRERG